MEQTGGLVQGLKAQQGRALGTEELVSSPGLGDHKLG